MRGISDVVLRFFELVEAEGRALRQSSIAVVENMLVIFFGCALMFFGLVVAGISLYLWLAALIGSAGAALVVSAALFSVGAILLVKGHRSAQRGRSVLSGSAQQEESLPVPDEYVEQAE